MTVYLDRDFKCHAENDGTLTAAETPFFDGKCRTFIEGYRFIPAGQRWTREDGIVFHGEMAAPWRDYQTLVEAQAEMEETGMILNELLGGVKDVQSA